MSLFSLTLKIEERYIKYITVVMKIQECLMVSLLLVTYKTIYSISLKVKKTAKTGVIGKMGLWNK